MEVQLDDEPMCLMVHYRHTILIISVFFVSASLSRRTSFVLRGTRYPRREVSYHMPSLPTLRSTSLR